MIAELSEESPDFKEQSAR